MDCSLSSPQRPASVQPVLNRDAWQEILSYLSPSDFAAAASTCKLAYSAASAHHLLQAMAKSASPHIEAPKQRAEIHEELRGYHRTRRQLLTQPPALTPICEKDGKQLFFPLDEMPPYLCWSKDGRYAILCDPNRTTESYYRIFDDALRWSFEINFFDDSWTVSSQHSTYVAEVVSHTDRSAIFVQAVDEGRAEDIHYIENGLSDVVDIQFTEDERYLFVVSSERADADDWDDDEDQIVVLGRVHVVDLETGDEITIDSDPNTGLVACLSADDSALLIQSDAPYYSLVPLCMVPLDGIPLRREEIPPKLGAQLFPSKACAATYPLVQQKLISWHKTPTYHLPYIGDKALSDIKMKGAMLSADSRFLLDSSRKALYLYRMTSEVTERKSILHVPDADEYNLKVSPNGRFLVAMHRQDPVMPGVCGFVVFDLDQDPPRRRYLDAEQRRPLSYDFWRDGSCLVAHLLTHQVVAYDLERNFAGHNSPQNLPSESLIETLVPGNILFAANLVDNIHISPDGRTMLTQHFRSTHNDSCIPHRYLWRVGSAAAPLPANATP